MHLTQDAIFQCFVVQFPAENKTACRKKKI